ncbi:MAG: hypothetical protein IJ523_03350 [Succinivibrionaceae bacterium]|nr:hypothetical protein [Succinivibrionaceae bacterium]
MYQSRSYNKRMNVWYAYEVEYVWDELKQRKVPKRRCIGKIDPATDQIVPNGKRGRARVKPVLNQISDADETVQSEIKSVKPKQLSVTKRKFEERIRKLALTMSVLSQQMAAILSQDLESLIKCEEDDDEQTPEATETTEDS